ncbi:hypothetical protein QYE76_024326, partial [Lolium multiflorum]
TAYHPQTDGQTERVNQILEDMLRACVLEYGSKWEDCLPYAEFSYNNSYQASLQMAPFEALYGRKCRTPLNWSEVGESQVFGPDVLREAEEKVHKIREYLKTAQSRQKSYADKRRREMTFEIGDFVYLKVSPLKGMQRFQLKGKLAPRYVGPFKVLSRRGEVSYQLELPEEMAAVHNVFHISLLRKCLEVPEKTEVFKNIDHRSVDINTDLTYREVPIRILEEAYRTTRTRSIKSEGKIFVAKNGTFLEKEFLTKEVTGRKVELDEIEESLLVDQSSAVPENVPVPPTPATEEANDNDHETSNETATEPRRSTRDRATPDWYDPCLNVMIVDNNDEDPATYEEAMMSPDSNKWQEAMKSEMGSMYDNKVWTLVDLPDSRKAVENKWIFKRKTDADGNITVYKARLVAKGFRQIQGVDYDETFSPVAKLKSVRILLAIAAFFDYEIWQMDVKTAFLNGDIEEELYMVQPKGFVDPKNADKVCKLQRSIYGLKQASRSWNRRFDKVIKDFGFIQCHGEACIYKKVSGSSVAFLILYVDDILLIGNDIELLSSVKGYLNNSFSMKDLGEASYILGIKIYRDRSRRLIGLDKILKKFRMDESKKGFLPMLPGKVLSKTQGPATAEERERMSQIPYASAVGSIMYAMLCTRPDIAHAVSLTSRYQSDPGIEHWTAVKNILKYLKELRICFFVME